MRIIMIGSEYAGKTTLSEKIYTWFEKATGERPWLSWHDHFVMPFKEGTTPEAEAEAQAIPTLPPSLLEKYVRYMIDYHFQFYGDSHHCVINWYYADAVYAPLYYGYGGTGHYADRRQMARSYDSHVMKMAPDTVLILVKARPELIRERMKADPRPTCPLKEADVETVVTLFQEEFDHSMIRRRFELDTSDSTPEKTFEEFLKLMVSHWTAEDRLRMVSKQITTP
jgi:thymidylate kinase